MNTRKEEIYEQAHSAALAALVPVLGNAGRAAESAAFSGAGAALFALVVEGLVSQGQDRQEAVARAHLFWTGYFNHLAAQAAGH